MPRSWVAQPQRPQALAQPVTTNEDVSEMALVPRGPWQACTGQDVEGRFTVTLSVCVSAVGLPPFPITICRSLPHCQPQLLHFLPRSK